MSEWITVNGHRMDCAYIVSLDSYFGYEPCDCQGADFIDAIEDEDFWNEDDEEPVDASS